MRTCSGCGHGNPDDAHFCSSCGTPLVARTSGELRKVVSILFADVVDSTSLGEQLDPESLRSVLARYFETARASLENHGASVEKSIGDAVMAVFGVPVVHEDDGLRAVRAAAELRDSISRLNEDLGREYGVSLRVRIGVNTGEVVVGTSERLATGDAVNVAARLEARAEPGEILLGEETVRLARNAIEVDPVAEFSLKGKADPVRAYRLRAVVEGAPAFERTFDAPLVGRRVELGRIRQAFAQAIADRRCRLVTVLGPPGIGKSRLVREVAGDLRREAVVLSGRCLPYGEGITFWPLREIFTAAGADNEIDAALGAGAAEEIFLAVRRVVEGRARERPLVLIFEDIHWAEPTLLDLIEHLAEWTRDVELLIICLSRPELLDVRPGWPGGRQTAETFTLAPLGDGDIESMIRSLPAEVQLSEGARARIREVAEGNPLFVEQLVASFAEGGDVNRIPPTIHALLAARLDTLSEAERSVLERASVIGYDFDWLELARLEPSGQRPAGAVLTALMRKDLIATQEGIEDGSMRSWDTTSSRLSAISPNWADPTPVDWRSRSAGPSALARRACGRTLAATYRRR